MEVSCFSSDKVQSLVMDFVERQNPSRQLVKGYLMAFAYYKTYVQGWNKGYLTGHRSGYEAGTKGASRPQPAVCRVTGAFRPDGLVFTRPCKTFQAKVFKEKKT